MKGTYVASYDCMVMGLVLEHCRVWIYKPYNIYQVWATLLIVIESSLHRTLLHHLKMNEHLII